MSELTLCDSDPGHTPVVAGTVRRIVVALDSEIVVTPPNLASMVWKFGLSADVPQAPVKSPVFGTISDMLLVTGSVMRYPFGVAGCGVVSPTRNFFLASSVCALDSKV